MALLTCQEKKERYYGVPGKAKRKTEGEGITAEGTREVLESRKNNGHIKVTCRRPVTAAFT